MVWSVGLRISGVRLRVWELDLGLEVWGVGFCSLGVG